MTSFATHRQRVHDTDRSARARHAALRTCVVSFAPYGFRATYHHLCHSAAIPSHPEADPDSLVRAVEELDAARRLWRADEAAHVERRGREKALGRRAVVPDGGWRDQPGPWLAFCPDPEFHPAEPLPVVVARVLASFVPPGPDAEVCRVCGGAGGTTRWSDGHLVNRLCARCGVRIRADGAEAAPAVAAAREKRWKKVWSAKGGREPAAARRPAAPRAAAPRPAARRPAAPRAAAPRPAARRPAAPRAAAPRPAALRPAESPRPATGRPATRREPAPRDRPPHGPAASSRNATEAAEATRRQINGRSWSISLPIRKR